jgi:hypothetical protein
MHTGERRSTYRIWVVRHDRKNALGRPMRMWKYNIKIDFQHSGWRGMDWINVAQDRNRGL